jgi:hypothetical protein
MGTETKIECAGEDQQQFNDGPKTMVKTCMSSRVVSQKNMVISPAGFGTKNDCAGEDQQQFTDRPKTLTLNMGSGIFSEKLENFQRSTQRIFESRSHKRNFWSENPRPRIEGFSVFAGEGISRR